jgi:hypothetical protein
VKIFFASKSEKKRLLRTLIDARPRGAAAQLARHCNTDPHTVQGWLREKGGWTSRYKEPQIWEFFGLTGEEDFEAILASASKSGKITEEVSFSAEKKSHAKSWKERTEERLTQIQELMNLEDEEIDEHLERQLRLLLRLQQSKTARATHRD